MLIDEANWLNKDVLDLCEVSMWLGEVNRLFSVEDAEADCAYSVVVRLCTPVLFQLLLVSLAHHSNWSLSPTVALNVFVVLVVFGLEPKATQVSFAKEPVTLHPKMYPPVVANPVSSVHVTPKMQD